MALSDQIDLLAFFPLRRMTYRNFINSGIQQSAVAFLTCMMALRHHVLENLLSRTRTSGLQKVNVCKCHREYSGLLKIGP
jgi:hypothetical protein